MNITQSRILAVLASLVCFACGGTTADDGQASEESIGRTEQAQRACTVIALCVEGYHWDSKTCRCARDRGVTCGNKTCASGDVCCNESCGICTPPDGVCTQQICN
jgi:hypothetical protein